MLKEKIAFIGGGRMGEAIFGGLLRSKYIDAKQLYVSDISKDRLDYLKKEYKLNPVLSGKNNAGTVKMINDVDIVVLAIVPQVASSVLSVIAPELDKKKLVISIMGGVQLEYLQSYIKKAPVVRIMPNVTMKTCAGIAGVALGKNATEESKKITCGLFDAIGKTFVLPESLIDPLTGISGCGPAYAAMFIEALADGGVAAGLPRATAIELAAQLLVGTGKMVLEQNIHPEVLKDSVCTPGGSTIKGCRALERGAFRATVISAVDDAIAKMQDVAEKAK